MGWCHGRAQGSSPPRSPSPVQQPKPTGGGRRGEERGEGWREGGGNTHSTAFVHEIECPLPSAFKESAPGLSQGSVPRVELPREGWSAQSQPTLSPEPLDIHLERRTYLVTLWSTTAFKKKSFFLLAKPYHLKHIKAECYQRDLPSPHDPQTSARTARNPVHPSFHRWEAWAQCGPWTCPRLQN